MIDPAFYGKHVLVVDDDAELRGAIIFDLQRRGSLTYEAANGVEAFELMKLTTMDIVISDVRMPNGSGIELLKKIREINTEIPFVLLATGFADLTVGEALILGAQALMEKPIDRKKMLALIGQALAAGSSLQSSTG